MDSSQWTKKVESGLDLSIRTGRQQNRNYRDWIQSVGFSESNLAPDIDGALSLQTKNQLSLQPVQNRKIVILDEMLKAFVQRQGEKPLSALKLETVKKLRAADNFDHYLDKIFDTSTESGIIAKTYTLKRVLRETYVKEITKLRERLL